MSDLSNVSDEALLQVIGQRQARSLENLSDDELLGILQSRQPKRPGVMATIDSAVRGAADTLTFGTADEIAGFLDTVVGKGPKGTTYGDFGKRLEANIAAQRGVDAADEAEHPYARIGGQVAGGVTGGLGAARNGLSLTERAIARGASRPVTVGASAVEGAVGGSVYGLGSGEGGLSERAANVPANAAAGFVGGAAGQAAAPYIQRGVTAVVDTARRVFGRRPTVSINPAEVAQGMGVEFRKDAASGTKGLVDQATDIPLTQGQAARDFSLIAKEEAMRNDALGQGAGQVMRQFDERQGKAIEEAAGRVTGGQPGRALTDAAALAEDVRSAYGSAKAKTKAAYDNAALSDATTDASMFTKLGSAIKSELENADNPFILERELHPAATQAIKRLDDFVPEVKDGVVVGVTAQKLESMRKVLRSYEKSAVNDGDKYAMKAIIRRFDDVWDTMAENGLFKGSDEAINALKVARQARREQGMKFEPHGKYDDAGRFLESVIKGNRSETEVANYLFGASKVGEQGKAVRIIDRMEKVFGKDAPQMQRLRQGALDRLLYEPEGKLYGNQRMVSRITDYLDGAGREYAKRLHTPEQLKAIREFRDAVEKTIPPKGTTNPSGSAWAGSRLVQEASKRLMQVVGITTGGAGGIAAVIGAEAMPGIRGRLAARAATQGGFPIPKMRPSPMFESASATGGIAAGTATAGALSEDEKKPLEITVRGGR